MRLTIQNWTPGKLKSIVREYINRRNPNGIYVAVAHTEQKHYHIHLCVAGIEYRSGKPLRMSKADMKALKQTMETFQRERYPELVFSRVQHDKEVPEKGLDKEYQLERRSPQSGRKTELKNILATAAKAAQSWQDFLVRIGEQSITPYYRNKKLSGFRFQDGRRYRLKTLGLERDGLIRIGKEKGKSLGV